jgi:hypothetical protein
MRRLVVLAVLVAGCGSAPLAGNVGGAAAGGGGGGGSAGGASHDAGDAAEASHAAGDAEAADASCDHLHMVAQAAFDSLVATYLGCATDADCAVLPTPALCLNECDYILNRAAVTSAIDTAAQLCVEFNADGCSLPGLLCPAPPSAACDNGTCVVVP